MIAFEGLRYDFRYEQKDNEVSFIHCSSTRPPSR